MRDAVIRLYNGVVFPLSPEVRCQLLDGGITTDDIKLTPTWQYALDLIPGVSKVFPDLTIGLIETLLGNTLTYSYLCRDLVIKSPVITIIADNILRLDVDIANAIREFLNSQPAASTMQVGGDQYKGAAIQPAEFISKNNIPFLAGCVIERCFRHDKPTGKGRQDIEKAIHELQLILEYQYSDAQ